MYQPKNVVDICSRIYHIAGTDIFLAENLIPEDRKKLILLKERGLVKKISHERLCGENNKPKVVNKWRLTKRGIACLRDQ